jgi:penicillin-binding protein 1A
VHTGSLLVVEAAVHPTALSGRLGPLTARIALLVVVVAASAVLVASLALPGALAASDVLDTVERDVLDIPPMGDATAAPQNSYVYAADGSELAELTFEENRVPVTLDEVPQDVINAVLATEDADFYEHGGVDHTAIARAFVTNIRGGGIEQGGSTITQQYVKNAFLDDAQTYQRKLQEAVYAIELERRMTKPEILESYLNRTYFGQGVYGIGTAAERYFSKEVGDLTLAEAATLAGIIRSPERNNPISSAENAETRRNVVLRQMAFHGFVTEDQARVAAEQELGLEVSEPTPPTNPFWVEWVSRLLTNDRVAEGLGSQTSALTAMGSTFEERRRMVFQSGLRIHTTLDPEMQAHAEATLKQHLSYEDELPEELAREPMGALVSVDPASGGIKAMAIGPQDYGSCSEDDSWVGEDAAGRLLCDRTKLNPVVPVEGSSIGKRQPGSAFKPFLTAAALEEGIPPTLEMDSSGPRTIENCGGGEDWEIRNVSGDGNLDMYEAMARSSNVYHGLLVDEVGPDKLASMAQRLGIKPLAGARDLLPAGAGQRRRHPAGDGQRLRHAGQQRGPLRPLRDHPDRGRRGQHDLGAQRGLHPGGRPRGRRSRHRHPRGPRLQQRHRPGRRPRPLADPRQDRQHQQLHRRLVRGLRPAAVDRRLDRLPGRHHPLRLARAGPGRLPPGDELEEPACVESRRLQNVTVAGQHYSRIFGGTLAAPMWASYMRQAVQAFSPEPFPDPPAAAHGRGARPAAAVLGERGRGAGRAGGLPPAHPDRRPLGLVGHLRRPVPRIGGGGAPGQPPDPGGLQRGRGPPRGPRRRGSHARGSPRGARRARLRRCRPGRRGRRRGRRRPGGRPVTLPGDEAPDDEPVVVLEVGVPAPDDDDEDEDDEDDEDEDDEDDDEDRDGRGPGGSGPPGQNSDDD